MGADKSLRSIRTSDADAFKSHLIEKKFAKATIAKRIRYARHFMEVALRRKLIEANPFGHISGTVVGNPERRVFVPVDVIEKVIDVAPDPQWKLLIALARYGGLRIPSEVLTLKWGDVDFAEKRFVVRAGKTSHHEHGGVRIVPMFPELTVHLQWVFDEAELGTEHVISRYRESTVNRRTQFQRYITVAGVKPWPKLWHNLRASRATELVDQFPSHVCAAWLGHTEAVAMEFYRQVTAEHFAKATIIHSSGLSDQSAARIPAQKAHAAGRTLPQAENDDEPKCPEIQTFADACQNLRNGEVDRTGLEPVTSSTSKRRSSQLS